MAAAEATQVKGKGAPLIREVPLSRVRNIGIMAHIDAGQDHDDRADPVLHGPDLQDRRGPRGRGGHGLDAPGAGARHHHHVGCHHVPLARHLDQHHRHARPRRLHRRGRAVAARARRRGGGVRRGRRRRAPDRDRVASGQQVQRAPHVLRQQDGPRRRRLLPLRRHDQGPPRRDRRAHAAADRRRERLPRRDRPARDARAGVGRRHGRELRHSSPSPTTCRPTR